MGRIILLPLLNSIFLVHEICLAVNKNATLDRNGLVGAIPEEDLIWKKALACEGQKLYIECPKIYNRIQVRSTFYGRKDAVTCKHPELPSDKICVDQNATVNNIVMDLCQGEARCEIAVTNDFLAQFGTIICPNVYKYLDVKYRCVPETALPNAPALSPYATSVTSTVTSNHAPVQCCYVVPDIGTSHTSVGGTIVRHHQGIQSVEERIVSQSRPVQQIHKVTEIIHSHPVQGPETRPAKVPLARLTLPGGSKLQLNTMIEGWPKGHTHQIQVGSPVIRSNIWGLQRKHVITRPYLSLRNSTHDAYRTLKTKTKGAAMGTKWEQIGSQKDCQSYEKTLRDHRGWEI
ncbi:proline-rich 12-like [Paramuricea clavata]|uniref:Proline-rich 12-like n=1 Tax=Paramuricea clavata TaxID=317549 RepID=A0A6S7G3E7_PARCT|nr:proline-rich 12-like [Paramuricea clavata]